ncbi:MAG: alpha/beta fold hydrolase [Chloroflexi bacterium]|nr:alpha/beta fold hydrolase [Chloroflexota bacterium]
MVSRRDLTLHSEGIPLAAALFVPDGRGPHPALVVCHGVPAGPAPAAGASPLPEEGLSYPELAALGAARGFATLVFNFRGTGQSGGNFHPLGWARDLEAVLSWTWEQPEVDVDRIAVLGSSMGAQVAICVTAQRPEVAGLVAYASPARAGWRTLAREMVARFREIGIIRDPGYPPSLEAWRREFDLLNPLEAIARIAPRPLLILQGEADTVVPPAEAHLLYDHAGDPKELVTLPGVGHHFRREPAAIEGALGWLERRFLPR